MTPHKNEKYTSAGDEPGVADVLHKYDDLDVLFPHAVQFLVDIVTVENGNIKSSKKTDLIFVHKNQSFNALQ